ncbi:MULTISPECIES: hypothetical protein [Nostoc]|nr:MULTISPECIES: hypothetical protein [Nostoc]
MDLVQGEFEELKGENQDFGDEQKDCLQGNYFVTPVAQNEFSST